VEFIEDALWELIESGASVADSLGATSYSDVLADAGKRGALEKGVGALVLSGPEASLKSWFAEIARKLNKGEKLLTEDLAEVSKTSYFSRDEMSKLFGAHIAGECEQCLRTYNPAAEFVFVRLYLSTGHSGDGSLLWDVVQYEEPAPELVRIFFSRNICSNQLLQIAKFAAPVVPSPAEAIKLLLSSLKLEAYDAAQLGNGAAQNGKEMLLRQHCAACDKKREQNLACGGCGVVMYCERACQVADWKARHKQGCAQLKLIREHFLK
jgi:hypothetical protein